MFPFLLFSAIFPLVVFFFCVSIFFLLDLPSTFLYFSMLIVLIGLYCISFFLCLVILFSSFSFSGPGEGVGFV